MMPPPVLRGPFADRFVSKYKGKLAYIVPYDKREAFNKGKYDSGAWYLLDSKRRPLCEAENGYVLKLAREFWEAETLACQQDPALEYELGRHWGQGIDAGQRIKDLEFMVRADLGGYFEKDKS